ncbi:MAG TPA: hypothetical protein VFT19_13235 [Solirubrobacterales bacterium]|nr:hypothetical protein [Solirubrobacterales bacterium]
MPLGEDAFYGLAGEIVQEIEPHTEADPAAILAQLLTAVGNAIGRGSGFRVEADRHGCNLFVAIVGDTASARKGSSWGQARRLVEESDPEWADRIKSGASSGEGMIWEVRDPIEETRKKKEDAVADPGVDDKRLLVVETELASVLERMAATGNTLSQVLRQAWDGGKLDTLVKTNRATATGAHVSLIGHITAEELRRKLTATEQANGFANRILWIYAQRSKALPRGGDIESVNWKPYVDRLRAVLSDSNARTLDLNQAAWKIWEEVYEELSTVPPGLLGAVIARGPAQVRRLAVIYALLDGKLVVTTGHLRAALAIWRYAADSAALLFGTALGDPTADFLLARLREAPDGLRLKEIHDASGRHRTGGEIDRALQALANRQLVRSKKEQTGGRPATRWYAREPGDKSPPTRIKRRKRTKRRLS